MERISLNRKRTDMRYASPDGTRPNPELVERAQRNFIRRQHHRIPPSPSALPQPSSRLLARPNTRPNSRSKSPKPITIQGRNRRWTVKTHQKKPTPPNNKTRKSTTARGIKIKNKPKKRSKKKRLKKKKSKKKRSKRLNKKNNYKI